MGLWSSEAQRREEPCCRCKRRAAGRYLRGTPAPGPPAHMPALRGRRGTRWGRGGRLRPLRVPLGGSRGGNWEDLPSARQQAWGPSLTRVALLDPLPQQGESPWVPLRWMRKPRLRDAE